MLPQLSTAGQCDVGGEENQTGRKREDDDED